MGPLHIPVRSRHDLIDNDTNSWKYSAESGNRCGSSILGIHRVCSAKQRSCHPKESDRRSLRSRSCWSINFPAGSASWYRSIHQRNSIHFGYCCCFVSRGWNSSDGGDQYRTSSRSWNFNGARHIRIRLVIRRFYIGKRLTIVSGESDTEASHDQFALEGPCHLQSLRG